PASDPRHSRPARAAHGRPPSRAATIAVRAARTRHFRLAAPPAPTVRRSCRLAIRGPHFTKRQERQDAKGAKEEKYKSIFLAVLAPWRSWRIWSSRTALPR